MTISYQAMRGRANVPWFFPFTALEFTNLSTENNTTLTASSTIHTKGAWTELVASTSAESGLLYITAFGVGSNGVETSMLLDIATGASGSETVVAGNIAIGGAAPISGLVTGLAIPLPIRIASGVRLSARIQALVASDTVFIGYSLLKVSSSRTLPTSVDVIGTSTADSRGTAMSGASGTWVQLTASTANQYRAVYLVPSVPGATVTTTTRPTLDVGVGAAGSEVVLGSFRPLYNANEAASNFGHTFNAPIACDVPAGSRLAVRHNIASNPGQFAACLIGVPA